MIYILYPEGCYGARQCRGLDTPFEPFLVHGWCSEVPCERTYIDVRLDVFDKHTQGEDKLVRGADIVTHGILRTDVSIQAVLASA